MTVGVLRLELAIQDSHSLKDKRRALKSVKDRLSNLYNVSVAEVGALDTWNRAVLGIALVANEHRFVESCLDKIVDWARKQRLVTLIDYSKEMCL
jgi:uncharacterized protein YlxP (DUF503 family)